MSRPPTSQRTLLTSSIALGVIWIYQGIVPKILFPDTGELEMFRTFGVFQGYEFAWAQEKDPGLQPLALAVNVYTYPTVYVVTRRDDPATDFAGLQSHSLAIQRLAKVTVTLTRQRVR